MCVCVCVCVCVFVGSGVTAFVCVIAFKIMLWFSLAQSNVKFSLVSSEPAGYVLCVMQIPKP